jgi:hypothetical protein
MFQRFHDRFGAAGVVIAVVALIAALGGTALAAKGALTGKQKKEVTKIAKRYAGKDGAAGANGTNGKDGVNGTNGKDGTNGTDGTNGKSVAVGSATAGECPTGGATVQVAGEAATKKAVCNGGFSEEMEAETTLRGNWSIASKEIGAFATSSVSYLMRYPGATPPTMVLVRSGESAECSAVSEPVKALCEAENQAASEHCPGSVADPQAEPEFACFYVASAQGPAPVQNFAMIPGESTLYGATIKIASATPANPLLLSGTWAVTSA